ncbi:cobalt transporter [Halomicronema sp. CCY15110]|uniref:cobalt transporter n=1 Tax=Halomicronema sp. CCY15110 TaxID=2767773 RepID=UPI001950472E|nr:cobalt transporter [Halomicronema sp. CCY15110]
MKHLPLLTSVLALSLALSTPAALAHVGHGDEFQAEGGVDRVEVNAETDPLLGIQVSPIEVDGSGAVMIPVSALVEDGDRQLVFVLYENFYEPVPVTAGAMVGEMVEILEGLSVGEQLVTQGSLSLYAESRKTQTAEAEPAAVATTTSEVPAEASVAAETETESSEVAEATAETTEASGGFPRLLLAVIGGGVGLAVGAVVLTRKK